MLRADTSDFAQAAAALKNADAPIRREFGRSLRRAADPLGRAAVAGLAANMPRRGGLSARVAQTKPSIRMLNSGASPRVQIALKGAAGTNGKATDLSALNRGVLRHPVYQRSGRRVVWRRQAVTPGGATAAFEAGAPLVRGEVLRGLEAAINEVKGSI